MWHENPYYIENSSLYMVKRPYMYDEVTETPALLVKSAHINADCPSFKENVPRFSDFRHWTPSFKNSYLRA